MILYQNIKIDVIYLFLRLIYFYKKVEKLYLLII